LMTVRQEAFEKRIGTEVEEVGIPVPHIVSDGETENADALEDFSGKSLHATVLKDFVGFTQRILDEPPSEELLNAFEVLLRNAEEDLL